MFKSWFISPAIILIMSNDIRKRSSTFGYVAHTPDKIKESIEKLAVQIQI